MRANWSLMINILMLIGVVFAIVHLVKAKRRQSLAGFMNTNRDEQSRIPQETVSFADDIIAIRKIPQELSEDMDSISPLHSNKPTQSTPRLGGEEEELDSLVESSTLKRRPWDVNSPLMIFLLVMNYYKPS
jgi:cell division protein ZipA